MKVVWSEYCGKCGQKRKTYPHDLEAEKRLRNSGFTNVNHHVFVRVPLNFDEWKKAQADIITSEDSRPPNPERHCIVCGWAFGSKCPVCLVRKELLEESGK